MSDTTHRVPATLLAGALATMTMDAAMFAAARLDGARFEAERLDPGMIGRWVRRLARGGWRGGDLSAMPPSDHETALGLGVHYLTGITLTWLYVGGARQAGATPTAAKATAYGVGTSALPLLVMFPSMGYGFCGLRSGEAGRLLRVMVLGHVAFGAGIGAWSSVLGLTRPTR